MVLLPFFLMKGGKYSHAELVQFDQLILRARQEAPSCIVYIISCHDSIVLMNDNLVMDLVESILHGTDLMIAALRTMALFFMPQLR